MITVDIDCLDKEESATNWEHGLFKAEEIRWAIDEIRSRTDIVGGDLCGAYSAPSFERWKQRMESTLDHPKMEPLSEATVAERNARARQIIWSALAAN